MFSKEVFINRRNQLKKMMKGGVILFLGNTETPMNYPANTYRFRQDSSFLYFFGLNQAGFAGIIDVDNDKDYIFGNDVDIDDIIWMGPQPSVKEMAVEVGVNNTFQFNKLFDFIKEAISKNREVHYLTPYRAENKIILEQLLSIKISDLKDKSSEKLAVAVAELRSVKDKYEIEFCEKLFIRYNYN